MQIKGVWGTPQQAFCNAKVAVVYATALRKLCSVYGAVFRFVCRFRRTATIQEPYSFAKESWSQRKRLCAIPAFSGRVRLDA